MRIFFAILLLCAAGCSSTKPKQPAASHSDLVWPPAPNPPRIALVQVAQKPADFGAKRSGVSRFSNWLTGSEKGNETFVKPFGLALDENENLCLTDTGANTVSYFDKAARKWHSWNRVGKVAFLSPVAVAKQEGVFYVADSALGAIVAFDERGKERFILRERLERPAGICLFDNKLFIADSQRHSVLVFDLSGKFISEFGQRGTAPGEFNFPTHISVDSSGRLYVTDSINSRVQVFDLNGKFIGQIGTLGHSTGQFSRPKGVAVDARGNVYVLDALFDNAQIFSADGKFLLNFGEAGRQPGEFWMPNGIVITQANEIFIADSYNRRVQIFKYVGEP